MGCEVCHGHSSSSELGAHQMAWPAVPAAVHGSRAFRARRLQVGAPVRPVAQQRYCWWLVNDENGSRLGLIYRPRGRLPGSVPGVEGVVGRGWWWDALVNHAG